MRPIATYRDKLIHLAIGAVAYAASGSFSVLAGIVLTIAVAWGIEEWQRRTGKGVKDGWDAFAVMVGILPGHLLIMAFGDGIKQVVVAVAIDAVKAGASYALSLIGLG